MSEIDTKDIKNWIIPENIIKLNNRLCDKLVNEGEKYIISMSSKWFHKYKIELNNSETYLDQFKFSFHDENWKEEGLQRLKLMSQLISKESKYVEFYFELKTKTKKNIMYDFKLLPVAENLVGYMLLGVDLTKAKDTRGRIRDINQAIPEMMDMFYNNIKDKI